MMKSIEELHEELINLANRQKAKNSAWFFKTGPGEYAEGDKFLGITVPDQRKIAKKYYKDLSLVATEKLLQSEWHEERMTALFILVLQFEHGDKLKKSEIFSLYMNNTKYVNNWDLVDSSAHKIVGPWLEGNKYKMKVLKKLAQSDDLWERRIAILSTFYYISKGRADEALEISNILMIDSHDLIQKAVGWMLREIGKRVDRNILIEFLDTNAQRLPRTTLRYSIEHLPKLERQYYMHLGK